MTLCHAAQSMGNATFFQSVVNVINILSGVGLLSLPFALRKSGWAGLGVLWLMGFVTNYTGKPRHLQYVYFFLSDLPWCAVVRGLHIRALRATAAVTAANRNLTQASNSFYSLSGPMANLASHQRKHPSSSIIQT